MINEKNIEEIKKNFASLAKNVKFFIFGKSIKEKKFDKINIGIIGKINNEGMENLQNAFDDSDLPCRICLTHLDIITKESRQKILSDEMLWLKR